MQAHEEETKGSRNELTMLDLAVLLVRRRWWAGAGFALAVLVGGYFVLDQPKPGHEGTVAVELVPLPSWLGDAESEKAARASILRAVKREGAAFPELTFEVVVASRDLRLQAVGTEHEAVRELLDQGTSVALEQVTEQWLPFAREAVSRWQGSMAELVAYHDELRSRLERESGSLERAALISAEVAVRERIDAEDERGRGGHLARLLSAEASGALDEARITDGPSFDYRTRTPVIVFLTVAVGLFIALFVVFAVEFLARLRVALRQTR